MRILVVGAGAIGGYFGGRLLQAGNDVTFLVRPKRASELASAGLVIKSPGGDVTLKNPPTVQADKLAETFDVVLLSCKAFDLEDAIKSFAPAVGPQTAIIPLLNGMLHLNVLDQKFGADRVLGGLCAIAVTLNEAREVVKPARVSVYFNGVLVQDDVELLGPTNPPGRRPYSAHGEKRSLVLQDHKEIVRYRNIWIVPVND